MKNLHPFSADGVVKIAYGDAPANCRTSGVRWPQGPPSNAYPLAIRFLSA